MSGLKYFPAFRLALSGWPLGLSTSNTITATTTTTTTNNNNDNDDNNNNNKIHCGLEVPS